MRRYLRDAYVRNGLWLAILMVLFAFGPLLDGKSVQLGPWVTSSLCIVLGLSALLVAIGVQRVRRSTTSD